MPGELLHVEQQGSGPTLVLVHGVAGGVRIFDPVIEELAARFTVVRLDLLGYGASPKPRGRYDLPTHLGAIRRSLRENGVHGPAHLVGLSMGATLALAYTARWPSEVDGLVLIGLPYFRAAAVARLALRVNLFTRLAVEHPRSSALYVPPLWLIGRHLRALNRRFSTIYTEAMVVEALGASYAAFRSSVQHCMVGADLPGLVASSGDRRRLFIHGSQDRWAALDSVHAAIRPFSRSEMRAIEGAEHNTVVVAPSETAQAIIEHLAVLTAP